MPGVNLVMAQPISDRVDEMVTGVRADVAVKIFGDDLGELIDKAQEVARVAQYDPGAQAISRSIASSGQQNLTITSIAQAIARHGLNAADVNDVIEAAIGGKAATEIYEGERRFQAVVRFPEQLRSSVSAIRRILLTSKDGEQVPLDSLAHIELVEGPSQIKREMAKRRIVVGINVRDRDLGGFVAELQQKLSTTR